MDSLPRAAEPNRGTTALCQERLWRPNKDSMSKASTSLDFDGVDYPLFVFNATKLLPLGSSLFETTPRIPPNLLEASSPFQGALSTMSQFFHRESIVPIKLRNNMAQKNRTKSTRMATKEKSKTRINSVDYLVCSVLLYRIIFVACVVAVYYAPSVQYLAMAMKIGW